MMMSSDCIRYILLCFHWFIRSVSAQTNDISPVGSLVEIKVQSEEIKI